MARFCVCYELTKKGRDYSGLIEALRSYRPSWQGMQSVWIIGSRTASCQEVFERLRVYIDADDRLLVVPLASNASWWSQSLVEEEAPPAFPIS
jgi:hypothetical protein